MCVQRAHSSTHIRLLLLLSNRVRSQPLSAAGRHSFEDPCWCSTDNQRSTVWSILAQLMCTCAYFCAVMRMRVGRMAPSVTEGNITVSCPAAGAQVANYSSCSDVVGQVMAADVMRSCLVLVEDLLDVLPVLLYQVGAGLRTDWGGLC